MQCAVTSLRRCPAPGIYRDAPYQVSEEKAENDVKIARKGLGVDINLAIQYILNCGAEVAGSCHGGSGTGAYQVRPWEGAGAAVSRGRS